MWFKHVTLVKIENHKNNKYIMTYKFHELLLGPPVYNNINTKDLVSRYVFDIKIKFIK